jgi:hypothetical protein
MSCWKVNEGVNKEQRTQNVGVGGQSLAEYGERLLLGGRGYDLELL